MSLKGIFTRGVAWTSIERFSSYFIQFVISIILARLLSPTEYGILGILLIFTTISQVFIDCGFGSALVYFNDKNPKDLSTAFVFNFLVSLFFFILLFFCSPFISSFFSVPNLSTYLRAIIFILFFNSLQIVPTALMKIDLLFKDLAIINFSNSLFSGLVAIILAYSGFGIWALVAQHLSRSALNAFLLMNKTRFYGAFKFYKSSFQKIFSYSVNIFGTNCLFTSVDQITSFIVGKYLNMSSLGIYSRSKHFVDMPFNTFGSILLTVLFPTLASVKNDETVFNRSYKRVFLIQAFITIPVYFWLALESKNLILILLGTKWEGVILILRIMSVSYILELCSRVSENALMALGYSRVYLRIQSIKILSRLFIILITIRFGLIWMVCGEALIVFAQYFISSTFSQKYLHFSTLDQLKSIFPIILSSLVSIFIATISIHFLSNIIVSFSVSTAIMIFTYLACGYICGYKFIFVELFHLLNKRSISV